MQRILSLVIALALLVVPLGMIGGAAAAHAGAAHGAAGASDCHESMPAPPKKSKGVGMSAECALACAALPATPARVEEPALAVPAMYLVLAMRGMTEAGPESVDPPPRA